MKTKIRKILSVCLILSLLATLLPQTFVSAKTKLIPFGDLNGDGKIQSDDARIALRAAARVIEIDDPLGSDKPMVITTQAQIHLTEALDF